MKAKRFVRSVLSRRSVMAGFAVALALPALSAPAAGDSPAKQFLDSIYRRYVGSSVEGATGIPLSNAKAVRSYFTVGLASLINEDRAAAAKRGEPPVLDGDPFVGHQNWDISNLAIEVKDSGAVKAVGTVTFMNLGKPEKIVIELLRSGVDWRIADIEWDTGTLRGLYRRKAARDNEAAAPPP
jgi:uncharacterized protein DUF3828